MQRCPNNPILTRAHVPEIRPGLVDVSSIFNPGAIKIGDQYLLITRVQNRGRETFFLMAQSRDGVEFQLSNHLVQFAGIERVAERIYHCYDARITPLDGQYYIVFAMDMESGCRLGLARTREFAKFEFIGVVSEDDNRNGVLFSEKFNGKYLRLDRPNQMQLSGGPVSGNTICLSESDDLLHWRLVQPVASGRWHYWDELIGAGPPPIKTRRGWLQIYHGVATHFASANIYQSGVMLLDLECPGKVIGRSKYNILEPRELYELIGQVPNVVFPSGAIVEHYDHEGFAREDSEVKVYYGAADTCIGLATTTVGALIQAATET